MQLLRLFPPAVVALASLLLLIGTSAMALELDGEAVQGGLIFGTVNPGDRVYLDHGERAEMAGPADLTLKLSGPAALRCDANGLFLERGHAEVEGASGSARALRLRTPDGHLRPDGDGAFSFEVDVKENGNH